MSRQYGDVMLGPGGSFVHPVSESEALTGIIAHITHGDYRTAMDIAKALREQVGEGYHKNPGVYEPFKIVGKMGDDVHSVAYRHVRDRKLYKHDFQRGSAEVLAVIRHGKHDLLITSPDGKPLWDEFR